MVQPFDPSPDEDPSLRLRLRWYRPHTVRLNLQIIAARLDAEPPALAPVRAPRVAADPVLGAVVNAPPYDADRVVDARERSGLLRVHTARVLLERCRGVHAALDRPAREDFGLHLVRALDPAVVPGIPGGLKEGEEGGEESGEERGEGQTTVRHIIMIAIVCGSAPRGTMVYVNERPHMNDHT